MKKDALKIAIEGVDFYRKSGADVIVIDTAGRLQIDTEMMNEVSAIKIRVSPHQIYLVLDAMTGQEAVNIARQFNEKLKFDGIILTKLDSDTREVLHFL